MDINKFNDCNQNNFELSENITFIENTKRNEIERDKNPLKNRYSLTRYIYKTRSNQAVFKGFGSSVKGNCLFVLLIYVFLKRKN